MRFLLFTLYAPMGAFGEIAVGERRMGWERPARSAVLGLAAAALGIERENEDAHRALETGLHYAVRTDAPGAPFADYHTAQTPRARKNRTFSTRRDELRSENLHTVLSVREWRTDAFFTAALWPRPESRVDLDDIAAALREPRFTLYLGRKAAPLGLPLAPVIVPADSIAEAFARRERTEVEKKVLERIGRSAAAGGEIAFDAFDPDAPGAPGAPEADREVRRRDAVVSRMRWQFADRRERIAARPGAGPDEGSAAP